MRRSFTGSSAVRAVELAAAPCIDSLLPPWSEELPVVRHAESPRFGDDTWDLACVVKTPGAPRMVSWLPVPAGPWRVAAKEYAYLRLNVEGFGKGRRWKPEGLNTFVTNIASAAELSISLGIESPSGFTEDQGIRVLSIVRSAGLEDRYAQSLALVGLLYEATDHLSYAPPESPFGGRSVFQALGLKGRSENRTPRMPADVWRPLIRWSIRFVREFGPQILAERRWRDGVEITPKEPVDSHSAVVRAIARLRAEGRGLPYQSTRTGLDDARLARLSLSALARVGGISNLGWSALRPETVDLLLSTAETLGYQDERIRREWPDRFEVLYPLGFNDTRLGLPHLEKMLMVACGVVVAAFTGMRPSELMSLQPGCCSSKEVAGRNRPRFILSGTLYKGLEIPRPETWVTLEVGAEAVRMAEKLSDLWSLADRRQGKETGNAALFRGGRCRGKSVFTSGLLRSFVECVNRVAEVEQTEGIPTDIAGVPFSLQWKSFRRTLAWFIGQQPLGWAAGPLQYKHVGIELFSGGYHGSSKSDFRQEVAIWDAKRRWAVFEELRVRWSNGEEVVAGPGSAALTAAFASRDQRTFNGEVLLNHYNRLLLQEDFPLFPGEVNDCIFDPNQALCRRGQTPETAAPEWSLCDPARCPNAAFRSIHREPWERKLVQLGSLRARGLTSIQVAQNERSEAEVKKVLRYIGTLESNHAA